MKRDVSGLVFGYGLVLLFLLPSFRANAGFEDRMIRAKLPQPLEFGQIVEREMPPRQKHLYKIKLEAGQFVRVEAEQRGCDVIFSFLSPEGKSLLVFENNAEGGGNEKASVAAETSGEYELRVLSMHGAEAKRNLRTQNRRASIRQPKGTELYGRNANI